jgi:hypothetical protein
MINPKKNYQKKYVMCECGVAIYGNSDSMTKANLKTHKKSKLHKKQMESLELNKGGLN